MTTDTSENTYFNNIRVYLYLGHESFGVVFAQTPSSNSL